MWKFVVDGAVGDLSHPFEVFSFMYENDTVCNDIPSSLEKGPVVSLLGLTSQFNLN